MTQTVAAKSPLRSRTLIGVAVSLIFKLLALYGWQFSAELQGEVVQIALAAVSLTGDGLAVYGRFKAEHTLKVGAGGKNALKALLIAGMLGTLTISGPVACASYSVAQAEDATPAQVVYAAQDTYNQALRAAAVYVESDIADEDVVAVLHRLSAAATETILNAQKAVRDGRGESPAAAAASAAARHAVEAFVDYLTSKGIL